MSAFPEIEYRQNKIIPNSSPPLSPSQSPDKRSRPNGRFFDDQKLAKQSTLLALFSYVLRYNNSSFLPSYLEASQRLLPCEAMYTYVPIQYWIFLLDELQMNDDIMKFTIIPASQQVQSYLLVLHHLPQFRPHPHWNRLESPHLSFDQRTWNSGRLSSPAIPTH